MWNRNIYFIKKKFNLTCKPLYSYSYHLPHTFILYFIYYIISIIFPKNNVFHIPQ